VYLDSVDKTAKMVKDDDDDDEQSMHACIYMKLVVAFLSQDMTHVQFLTQLAPLSPLFSTLLPSVFLEEREDKLD